jgi:dTDP-4-amino-4,6-dideoxygalactose transaminase
MPLSVLAPLRTTLFSGFVGQGEKVDQFEKELAPHLQNDRVLAVNSCTSALNLALRLSGVGPDTEVIASPMTCTASNMPILERGADIVWADVNPKTGNMDPNDIEHLITPKTRAILCVHYGGYPCDLDEINGIAKQHGLRVIEDAAHALSAVYRGARVGSISDFTCFSFQAIKHLTTGGDGGAITFRSREDYDRAKLLRWYGISREEKGRTDFRCELDISEWGHKYNPTDIMATIGLEQLKYIDGIIAAHRFNAYYYNSELSDMRHLRLPDYLPNRISSYWLYPIFVDNRASFMEHMGVSGISVSQVHARNDKHSFAKKYNIRPLPGVDEFSGKQIAIPVGWWLTNDSKPYIISKIREYGKPK